MLGERPRALLTERPSSNVGVAALNEFRKHQSGVFFLTAATAAVLLHNRLGCYVEWQRVTAATYVVYLRSKPNRFRLAFK